MQTSYKIENDKLVISCDAETQAELAALGEDIAQDKYMYECFENITCNGLSWVAPEDIGALTDAPILSEGCINDDGKWTSDEPVFYYDAYQIKSPLNDLRDNGRVVFDKA